MRPVRSLLVVVISATSLSCEHPSATALAPSADGDPSPAGSILGTGNIPFNLSKALGLIGKPALQSLSVSPGDLATALSIGTDVAFNCERIGTGTLWAYYSVYDDPFVEYYNLECRAPAITPALDEEFNVSDLFRQANGPTVAGAHTEPLWLASPITADGKGPVAEIRPSAAPMAVGGNAFFVSAPGRLFKIEPSAPTAADADIGFICNETGEGTLHVQFAPESGVGNRSYAMACRPHDQGGGG